MLRYVICILLTHNYAFKIDQLNTPGYTMLWDWIYLWIEFIYIAIQWPKKNLTTKVSLFQNPIVKDCVVSRCKQWQRNRPTSSFKLNFF